jgi:ribosomal protein L13
MKKIKVLWNGEKLCNIYPHASKWQVFKFRAKRLARKVGIVALGIVALAVVFKAGSVISPVTVYQDKEVIIDAMPSKIERLKGEVADQLMSCESNGYTDEDGLIVFDSNHKASIGRFQFQKSTVIHYYNLIHGVKLTGKEAVMLALDTNKARDLAIRVMFETPNMAGKDWVNCDRKLGLDAQIKLIKKLY